VRLKGSFVVPGDKSISHRVALMSLLAEGQSRVSNLSLAADVRSSLNAVRSLGIGVHDDGDEVVITGSRGQTHDRVEIDCGNSGTTMRLLMGILAGLKGTFLLDGDDSLRKRPMERVAVPLRLMGANVQCTNEKCPIEIIGTELCGIEYTLPVASAQLKSAILLAGIQASGTTMVIEPEPSRDHTERLFEAWGGRFTHQNGRLQVQQSVLNLPDSLRVPGDISSAAFFLCAAAIVPGSDLMCEGVLLNPTRMGFLKVLERMGTSIETEVRGEFPEPWGRVRIKHTPDLTACTIRAKEIPSLVDEVPILALVATQAEGTTVFEGVAELRVKESDRLTAIASQLSRMGAIIHANADTLVVKGPTTLQACSNLESFGDHRIAMTTRLAAVLTDSDPTIVDETCVEISYPQFHETLRRLVK
jgi:3-phosphoshikimate 1-carboxyvinyltransferase